MGLKVYLNNQVSELKQELKVLEGSDILEGGDLKQKFQEVRDKLDSYVDKEIVIHGH